MEYLITTIKAFFVGNDRPKYQSARRRPASTNRNAYILYTGLSSKNKPRFLFKPKNKK